MPVLVEPAELGRGERQRLSFGKQKELEQRDELFLRLARTIVLEEGFQELTMSRLAEASGFTRGTLYQRFGSREGILVELWLQCLLDLVSVLEKGVRFPGSTRERVTAVGEAVRYYFQNHLENLRFLGAIGAEDVGERITDDQRARLAEADLNVLGILESLIEAGIDEGDLTLPDGATPHMLCLTLWSMLEGATAALRGGIPLAQSGLADPIDGMLLSVQYVLDGYGWRPLTKERDYEATRGRIQTTLFPTEAVEQQQAAHGLHRDRKEAPDNSQG